ncbi:potassium channel family protein [Kribbella sp. NPDC050241]|uniref:potassium channel family protein n=1 Tax=Kribbella sp. NPDC050241 TaxID=3364115 RepID=UPI00379DA4F1
MTPADDLTSGRRRWLIARGLLRAGVTAAALVVLYYVLPLDRRSDGYLVLDLVIGVVLLMATIAWQVRAILRAAYPAIRATQSLASTAPLFLLLFASTYFIMSLDDSGAFTEPLTRSDALYFTITVFSTVGFGDISPRGEASRLVVAAQMLLDLVVLGVGIQVILGATKRGKARVAAE